MSVADSAKANTAAERVPLSLNQEFVCLFDHDDEDAPFGSRYHIVEAWRVTGQVDTEVLHRALMDIVTRHEALRTVIVRDSDEKHQKVEPPHPPELLIRDLPADGTPRDEQAESLIRELEGGTIDPGHTPFLRAVLARFDDHDAVLALMTHHIATDGWSVRVIIRDLANRYAARKGHAVAELPDTPQYRELSAWQREIPADESGAHRDYWREKLRGARISTIPTDFPRTASISQRTSAHRFAISADVISSVSRLASSARSTKTMVMLAAHALATARKTASCDVVIATFTPGRGGRLFQDTVGSFFNFIPLRIDIAGCETFREVLQRTRQTCLEAYSHDIPTLHIFAEAPELMRSAMSDNGAPVVFQVFPDPVLLDDDIPGGLKYMEITRKPRPQERTSAVPDGALWTLGNSTSGGIVGSIVYKRNLFHETTIAAMAAEFHDVLRAAVATPDALLGPH